MIESIAADDDGCIECTEGIYIGQGEDTCSAMHEEGGTGFDGQFSPYNDCIEEEIRFGGR